MADLFGFGEALLFLEFNLEQLYLTLLKDTIEFMLKKIIEND